MNTTSTPVPNTPAVSQPPITYTPTPAEAELLDMSRTWMDVALRQRDEHRLREIMAPEFTLQIWDGSRAPQDLSLWLHTLLHRLSDIDFEYTTLMASVFGEFGVVYSSFWWKGQMDAQPFEDSGFMADVWIRRGGRWQVMSRRSAPQGSIRTLRLHDARPGH